MAKRIREARHYQDRRSPLRLIADRAIPVVRKDMREALGHLSELLPPNALQLARAGDWYGLRRDLNWTHFRGVMKGAFAAIGKAREAGAQHGAKQINGAFARAGRRVRYRKASSPTYSLDALFDKAVGDQFSFDLYDPATQDRIRQAQDDLIAQIEETARDTIESVVLSGAQEGLGPEDIVDNIRQVIGLTDVQAQATANFQQMLYDLDPQALERRLRNGNYDELLQGAIDSGEDLSDAMIGRMVDDYVDNYLDYRAETIARTESTRAASAGLQDSYEQAIDRGVFPSDAVKQFWKIASDERTCEICISAADMNEDGVAIGEMFETIDGQVDAPPIHPSCWCELEMITDLDKVPTDNADEEAA